MRKRVPAVAVVGYKNTGKTTLVTRLVAAFQKEGYRVGTCKHDGGHDFEIDRPDTDTWKHREAGAAVTLIASRSKAALQISYDEQSEPGVEEWLERLSDPQLGLDLVIVEGWKRSDLPKIVMVGSENLERLSNVIAYAADCKTSSIADLGRQVYDKGDIDSFVQLIKARVLGLPVADALDS
jgi:molybdopterin-guanine dinucleotide biosynthesis protein B